MRALERECWYMWDMAFSIRGGVGLALGGLLAAGCGNGDDLDPAVASPLPDAPVEIRPVRPVTAPPVQEEPGVGEEPVGGDGSEGPDEGLGDPDACRTPRGVSGSPRSLEQAIILMNSLPRPTSLACFLQALERPMSVYMTSSGFSLQPSPEARSPRTFIVNEPLVMSIVFDGRAKIALELGLRTTESRSIKTEIHFPIETDVNYDNFFSVVSRGESTVCADCHTGEVQTLSPELPIDVFESDIIRPFDELEVDVPTMLAERESCDEAVEPERCLLLSAFFDYGEVRRAPNGFMF
jgi:hypothetical protein